MFILFSFQLLATFSITSCNSFLGTHHATNVFLKVKYLTSNAHYFLKKREKKSNIILVRFEETFLFQVLLREKFFYDNPHYSSALTLAPGVPSQMCSIQE